jgi:hypothetical protein
MSKILIYLKLITVDQGFSKCGMHTKSDTPATVQQYRGLARKTQEVKKITKKLKLNPETHHIHTMVERKT